MTKAFHTIPGPKARWWGLPLLRAMQHDYLGVSEALHCQYGDMVRLSLVQERGVEVFHPDLMREALVEHADDLTR